MEVEEQVDIQTQQIQSQQNSRKSSQNFSEKRQKIIKKQKKQHQKRKSSKGDLYKPVSKEASENDKKIDLKICKFLDIQPSTILCMATNPTNKKLILIGRNNGTIEVWKLDQKICIFQQQLEKYVIPQRLIWTTQNINENLKEEKEYLVDDPSFLESFLLFSQNGSIFLYSLQDSSPLHWYSTGSRIWDASILNGVFLTAHEDGVIRCFSIEEDLKIQLLSSSPPYNNRCLSVCFDNQKIDNSFFVSLSDGTIKKCNKNFQVQLNMRCEKKVFAWQLVHTQNDILIAGSNEGSIFFFETKFGTLIKSYKKHEADILQMKLHPFLPKLYCTGSDSKIIVYDVSSPQNISFLQEFRGQSHDIFALDFVNNNELVSGGYTTDLCFYELSDGAFQQKKHVISLQTLDQLIAYNSKLQLVTVQKPFSLEIYQMDSQNYQFNIEIQSKNKINSFFQVGHYVGYTTNQDTYVFKIQQNKTSLKKEFYIQEGFKNIIFSIVNKQVIFQDSQNQLGYIQLSKNERQQAASQNQSPYKQIKIIASLDPALFNAQNMLMGPFDKSVIIGSKINSTIIEYSLEEQDRILYRVPNMYDQKETTFSTYKYFRSTNQLVVVYDNKKFVIFDMQERQLSKYSKDNIERYPQNFMKNQTPILQVFQHPKIKKRLIFYSSYYFTVVDLSIPFYLSAHNQKKQNLIKQDNNNDSNINANNEKQKQEAFKQINMQKPMIALRENADQLVVFETDFTSMIANLAEPVVSKKFNV
ncbi:WD40-repeat-containing domain [Pseudocohnilembus persalinus]|uniref:WD40-repeat-containing domain n=1 Tax=Pseudocohnilembus persalinus TaxID=266149 RepID=A0A0V0QJJ1_PSEPJ|nr:WD40-repeat-containing domain [Pseudocohnilembus persalinus]|eukprot:KRX02284.1 WD40-repeat-containing domain [Pseudocohnilembus persalinus]